MRVVTLPDEKDSFALWSVSTEGSIERIPLPVPSNTGWAVQRGESCDGPFPSPNGKLATYKEGHWNEGPLLLYDLASRSSVTVAKNPPAGRGGVSAVDWSWDGRRLLYWVMHWEARQGVPPDSATTYFIYDLETRTSKSAELAGCEYQAWLLSGELLALCEGRLTRISGKTREKVSSQYFTSSSSRMTVAENGTIAAVAGTGSKQHVVTMDPATFAETVVGAEGEVFGSPKPSPSAKHVAFLTFVGAHSQKKTALVVDRTIVAESLGHFEWIDDETLAVSHYGKGPSLLKIP